MSDVTTQDVDTAIARAKAKVQQMTDEGLATIAKIAEMRTAINDFVETAESSDRLITVTVNASGVPIEIELDTAAPSELGDGLGAAITATAQTAAHAVRQRANETMAELHQLAQHQREAFGGEALLPESLRQVIVAEATEPSMAPPHADERLITRRIDEPVAAPASGSRLSGGW